MHFAEVLKTLFDKVAGFFDIFDLSFFVAGTIALGAVAMEVHLIEREQHETEVTTFDQSSEQRRATAKAAAEEAAQTAAEVERLRAKREDIREEWTARLNTCQQDKAQSPACIALATLRSDLDDHSEKIETAQLRLAKTNALAAQAQALAEEERQRPKSLVQRYILEANPLLLVVGIYICGLICFAVARPIRLWILVVRDRVFREPGEQLTVDETMAHAIQAHGLAGHPFVTRYLEPRSDDGPGASREPPEFKSRRHAFNLYGLLWAFARESEVKESYNLLRRYWVLAATYDGVGSALILWAAVLLSCLGFPGALEIPSLWLVVLAIGLIVISGACFREARRLGRTQANDLLHTLAHRHSAEATEAAPGEQAPDDPPSA